MSVCGTLLGVIVGWILSLVTPFALRSLTISIFGPRLNLLPWNEPTPTNVDGMTQWYVNVEVHNDKRRIARQCRGYLLKIERMSGDLTTQNVFERTLHCIWEFDDGRDSFDIPKDAKPSFNAVMYEANVPGFSLRVRRSDGKLLHMGAYAHLFQEDVACSPKVDPCDMRVSRALMGKEILDERQEAPTRADHRQAA